MSALSQIEADLAYVPSPKEVESLVTAVWEEWLCKLHSDGIVYPVACLVLKVISDGTVARTANLNPYPRNKLQAEVFRQTLQFGQRLVQANTTISKQAGLFTFAEYTVVKAHPGIVRVPQKQWLGGYEMVYRLEWLEVGRKIKGEQKWTP